MAKLEKKNQYETLKTSIEEGLDNQIVADEIREAISNNLKRKKISQKESDELNLMLIDKGFPSEGFVKFPKEEAKEVEIEKETISKEDIESVELEDDKNPHTVVPMEEIEKEFDGEQNLFTIKDFKKVNRNERDYYESKDGKIAIISHSFLQRVMIKKPNGAYIPLFSSTGEVEYFDSVLEAIQYLNASYLYYQKNYE